MYSVIVPVKNGEKFILFALESILNQNLKAEEIIVVNDNSSDKSIEKILNKKLKVTLLNSNKNGQVAALNYGLNQVKSKYVAFLDADDLWLENKQDAAIEELEKFPELDIVSHGTRNFKVDSMHLFKSKDFKNSQLFSASTFRFSAFSKVNKGIIEGGPFTWQMQWWAQANKIGLKSRTITQIGHLRRIHDENLNLLTEDSRKNDERFAFLRKNIRKHHEY
jgi:glycosyltransferase involved in cell wall biosynthesis